MRAEPNTSSFTALLRGDPGTTDQLVRDTGTGSLTWQVAIIVLGAGLFGAAMGAWRSPTQALFTAVKFPLIVLLTTLGNALLNGMIAPLLGMNLRLRESLRAVVLSFTVTAMILGSLSTVLLFLVWNAPPLTAGQRTDALGFELVQLASVIAVAFGGIAGVARLLDSLRRLAGSEAVAWRVLLAWLAGNLLLGAQLAWNLRPFIGAPELPVEFFRPNAFAGNFFEAVLGSLARFFTN